MKLTPAQKRVIKAMREGEVLLRDRSPMYRCRWLDGWKHVGDKTVGALLNQELVETEEFDRYYKRVTLTQLGREI